MKAVIFEMDGVIFDSERAYQVCWNIVAKERKLENADEVFYKCIGVNNNQTYMIVEEEYSPKYGKGIADILLRESFSLFRKKYENDPLPMKNGVPEILEYLKQSGIPIGLASSTSKRNVDQELGNAGLTAYFDHITGGDAVAISKPNPEIYLIACREMGIEPHEAIAIEDSYNGIRAAHAAGMHPVMVPDMIAPDDEMKKLSEVICKDLCEVKQYLEKMEKLTDEK